MARVQPAAPTARAPFFDAEVPHERRADCRLFTLLRTGKLLAGSEQTICRVRNVSIRGFMADACPAPRPAEIVALELSEGRRLAAKVAWSQGDRFGAEFAFPQNVDELLGRDGGDARFRSRAVRVEPAAAFVTIFDGGRPVHASIVNISQTGMAVCGSDLSLDPASCRPLRLEIDGLGAMDGMLRWAKVGRAGIRFATPLSFECLGHWLWASSLAARQMALRG
jgi:hypothetical protein